ncbi:MAG TPA: helix-turn-helix transcriptional regulator [Acidimicrobiia bacterium]|jgi:transcriptional regulator with XRE-family HTH domain|nr:helix-turn-helix transcriptional regulator [Acidimicrobiia bacterium]
MSVAAGLLKQARLAAGWSARAVARQAGTAQARLSEIERGVHDPSVGTIDRSLRAVGWQLAVLPTRAPTAATVGLAVREAIDAAGRPASEERAFRSLLSLSDGLGSAEPALRVALSVAPPPPTGDTRFDAAIAAVVEYHLTRSKLPVPGWVREPSRTLAEPWTPDPYAGPELAAEVPEAFRRHGVLLAERELESV